jgi:hypothetical protein
METGPGHIVPILTYPLSKIPEIVCVNSMELTPEQAK